MAQNQANAIHLDVIINPLIMVSVGCKWYFRFPEIWMSKFWAFLVHIFDPVEHISVEIVFRDKVCLVLYENVSEQMIKHHDTVYLRT